MNVMRTPRSVDLSITNRCNLRCSYCSHFSSAGDVDRDLGAPEWLRFFAELNRCGVMRVTLEGGEPFCRPDLKELIAGIVRHRMRFSILSNGTLITDEMAVDLASTGRCDTVQVSIDGATPQTHDVFRGEGSCVRALRGIRILQKHGLAVSVRMTIHRKNVKSLESTAKRLLEEYNVPAISTNSASFMGLCRQSADAVQLSIEERTQAMEVLLKLQQKYDGRIGATAGPLAEAGTWLEMERARSEGRESLPGGGRLTGCGGVTNKIAVRADGIMVPCIQLSHIELGRINRDSLETVWNNHPELKKLRERSETTLSRFEFCRGCDYLNYCTGNCPALSYTILGEVNHPSPEACLKRFLDSGGRLPAQKPRARLESDEVSGRQT